MSLVGNGILFPIQLNDQGSPVIVTGLTLINNSIKWIIGWTLQTRIFLSSFGTILPRILEEPNDDLLKGLCEYYIYEALTTWEKRITIIDVQVVRTKPEAMDITITYEIKTTGLREVMTYPYYKEILT